MRILSNWLFIVNTRFIRGTSRGWIPAGPVPCPLGRRERPGQRAHGRREGEGGGGEGGKTTLWRVPCRCSLPSFTWCISTQNMEASGTRWTSLTVSQFLEYSSRFSILSNNSSKLRFKGREWTSRVWETVRGSPGHPQEGRHTCPEGEEPIRAGYCDQWLIGARV